MEKLEKPLSETLKKCHLFVSLGGLFVHFSEKVACSIFFITYLKLVEVQAVQLLSISQAVV